MKPFLIEFCLLGTILMILCHRIRQYPKGGFCGARYFASGSKSHLLIFLWYLFYNAHWNHILIQLSVSTESKNRKLSSMTGCFPIPEIHPRSKRTFALCLPGRESFTLPYGINIFIQISINLPKSQSSKKCNAGYSVIFIPSQ